VSDWHDFFVAQVGASGVLAGLVFVGVSINLEKIMSTPAYGLPGRALEALIVLLAVLTVSSVLLVPGQGTPLVGAKVLAVGVVDWAAVVGLQVLQVRHWQALEPTLRWKNFMLRAALGQTATVPFVAAGVAVLSWSLGGLYWFVAGVIFSYLVAMTGAWILLVETHR
jgi:hypothetical protein